VSAQAHYARVGAFVLGGIALAFAALVIVGGGGLFAPRPTIMETCFEESVQGLEVGSPVKLRGVKLGTVKWIGFVGDVYALDDSPDPVAEGNRVLVRMEIGDPGAGGSRAEREAELRTLVEKGLRLRLTLLGITGTSFIEADYLDPAKYPPMQISFEPDHLYVPSATSTISQLSSAAERLMGRIDKLDVESLLTHFDALLVNVNQAVEKTNVENLQRSVDELIVDLAKTSRELRAAVDGADVPALGADTRRLLARVNASLARVDRLLDTSGEDLGVALENLRVASANLREATDTARDYPSLLLRGAPPKPVGEPEP
jgi:ABC-type transporter Mla subunit MlaD